MPIGVPRIIYCWGEELPAQWTDIYNFIFRRRMVFLMQYLDDELCNQICGLLINIHMEDRSKELEKKEMLSSAEKKRSPQAMLQNKVGSNNNKTSSKFSSLSAKSVEDLLTSEDDLAIDQNNMLEQYTLQKITMEWLNWNAQFLDYTDEPYLYYLADILSKDFTKDTGNLMYNSEKRSWPIDQRSIKNFYSKKFFKLFQNMSNNSVDAADKPFANYKTKVDKYGPSDSISSSVSPPSTYHFKGEALNDVYSPFRLLANFAAQNYNYDFINGIGKADTINKKNALKAANNKDENTKNSFSTQPSTLFEQISNIHGIEKGLSPLGKADTIADKKKANDGPTVQKSKGLTKLLNELAQQKISKKLLHNSGIADYSLAEKTLGQRNIKREYLQDRVFDLTRDSNKTNKVLNSITGQTNLPLSNRNAFNYLDTNSYTAQSFEDYRQFYRKQTERTIQEEESKKVFVIINSFGGSVGNGITVHDALQFIKAGSLTLGLGVAASAASLVLAGGTIGERYVTEGCHVMIHQPEGGLNGQASDIWIDANEIMKIRLDVAEIYSLSTYRPRHKILRDLDRDFYLTATETIQYGLADEIATNDVMHSIVEMTSKVWDFHDSQQQRLLESRESASAGLDTQTQT